MVVCMQTACVVLLQNKLCGWVRGGHNYFRFFILFKIMRLFMKKINQFFRQKNYIINFSTFYFCF